MLSAYMFYEVIILGNVFIANDDPRFVRNSFQFRETIYSSDDLIILFLSKKLCDKTSKSSFRNKNLNLLKFDKEALVS